MRTSFKHKKRNTGATPNVNMFLTEEELPADLHVVLDSRDLRSEFMAFLTARLANESLLFYESIELYERITIPEVRNKAGRKMVEEFVMEDSVYWVNVSASLRVQLTKLTIFNAETFSTAKTEVLNLMDSNFFDSFRRHLTGVDTESAPKLSFDVQNLPFKSSMSFEQLAEELGEDLYITGDDEGGCGCKNSKDGEICCEKKRGMMRMQAMGNNKWSGSMPTSILKKLGHSVAPSDGGEVTSPTKHRVKVKFMNLFGKPKKRRLSFWAEFESVL